MSRLFTCGFELQSLTLGVEVSSGNNNLTSIDTVNARIGGACAVVAASASSSWFGHKYGLVVAAPIYARAYIQMVVAPAGGDFEVLGFWDSGGATRKTNVRATTGRQLRLSDGNGVQIGGLSAALTIGTYYRLEVLQDPGLGYLEARLDGIPFASGAGVPGQPDALYFGSASGAQTCTMRFDDIAINDTAGTAQLDWPGEGHVTILRPTGPGDIAQGSRGGADSGSNAGQVNEVTPNDATNYWILATDGDAIDLKTGYYSGSTRDAITLVHVGIRERSAAAGGSSFRVRLKSRAGGTLLQSGVVALADTTWRSNANNLSPTMNYQLTAYVDTQTGLPWTPAIIDTIQIGADAPDATPDTEVSTLWLVVEAIGAPVTGVTTRVLVGSTQAVVPAAEFDIRLKNAAGTVVANITDYVKLTYSKRINEPGSWAIVFDETNSRTLSNAFVLDGQIEIRRNVPGLIAPYLDFEGFYRDRLKETAENGTRLFTGSGPGYLDLAARRAVLYAEGSGFASKRGAAETVMKAYVNENCTSIATTANGRFRAGNLSGLTSQANGGLGTSWQGDRYQRLILEVLQGISLDAGDCEFNIVGIGAALYEFRTYSPRNGVDRRAPAINATGLNTAGQVPCVFSVDFGNLERPALATNRAGERTAFIVFGTGQFGDKKFAVSQSAAASDSPWNDAEAVVNSQNTSSGGLLAEAATAAARMQAQQSLTFNPIQTFGSLYGRNYGWGDYVSVRYDPDTVLDLRIIGVTVDYADGVETLTFEVALPTTDHG